MVSVPILHCSHFYHALCFSIVVVAILSDDLHLPLTVNLSGSSNNAVTRTFFIVPLLQIAIAICRLCKRNYLCYLLGLYCFLAILANV